MWWKLCPAGMTFDSGSDLLLGYSDERLCLPSDNCSVRGRERSINQIELRYRRTLPPMAKLSMLLKSPAEDPETSDSEKSGQSLPSRVAPTYRAEQSWKELGERFR